MLGDLAVFGGPPAFSDFLHVGRPNIGDRAILHERLNRILDARWLTNHGPMVEEFEQRISNETGARHCVAVCNATAGLQVVAHALGLRGEVIMPSFTFVATAHAMRWIGLRPVFCDIDPTTHTLDAQRVEELVSEETTAILGVHLWGGCGDVDGLADVARRHGLRLIFDAAHAFGGSYRGSPIGGQGDAEVFSFHATKFVNAFEGGAITTNDDDLARELRLAQNFGFAGLDQVVGLGTNAKMSEISAAMGLTSLEAQDDFVAMNKRNYAAYRAGLAGIDGLGILRVDDDTWSHQYVVIEVDERRCGLSRNVLLGMLRAENVLARRYFYPGCHRMQPYVREQPEIERRLPVTQRVAERVLVLPTGTGVTTAEVQLVCALIREAVQCAPLPEISADVSSAGRSPWT